MVGPEGFEPSTKRIQAHLHLGYNFILYSTAEMNLAVRGAGPDGYILGHTKS
jgi:hypothetical protein